jgi:putative SOS response-associated peptidase YedK
VLPRDRVDAWLDPAITEPDRVRKLLTGVQLDPLEVRRVSTAVNKVSNNGPELVDPVGDEADRPLELALA